MALVVNLKSVDYLQGKADRIVKLTFRESTFESNVVRGAKRVAYFGQTFQWPIGRGLRAEETLQIQLFNHNKYLIDKLLGTYSICAQQLMQDGELIVNDALVDNNNKVLETLVSFEVHYYSPDGKVGDWYNKSDFVHPVVKKNDSGKSMPADDDENFPNELNFNANNLESAIPNEDTASLDALDVQQNKNKKCEERRLNKHFVRVACVNCSSRFGKAGAEYHSNKDFEVRVTIIKGEALAGLDVDPVIRVDVGDQMRYTAIKQSTNAPYYNEYLVFDFHETPATFFDKIITISAYHAYGIPGRQMLRAGNMVAGKKLIGSFKCDVGTVFSSSGHQFYHKWAALFNPKDMGSGPKGYIKCDIVICGHGAIVKRPPGVTDDETDDIYSNILLPPGVPLNRQRASYRVSIFRAEDLPRTNLGLFASVQKAVTNKDVAFIDAFIKVHFAGQVGKTSVVKSYNPEWKEVLVFSDMFPPLCNRIKIELCDSEITNDETVAVHFIELAQIMDPGSDSAEGILPTFGPSWINLYGSPRGFKIVGDENDEDVNQGIGEGSAFRGRLLLSFETVIVEGAGASKATVKREKLLRSSGVMDNYPRQPFLLFGTLFEATMIDKQLEKKSIYFELSIGKFGNTLDSKARNKIFDESSGDSSDEETDGKSDRQSTALLKKKDEERAVCVNNSTTSPHFKFPANQPYGYMQPTHLKPCLFTVGLFEDFRKRLYHSNILSRMYESLDDGLFDVKEMMRFEDPLAHRRLKGTLDIAMNHCEEYIRMFNNMRTGAGAGKTQLDKYRMKECYKFVDEFRTLCSNVRQTTTVHVLTEKYLVIREALRKLYQLTKDPQHALPDVLLWMICDKKRVAYHRFNARDLIYSNEDLYRGSLCGKRQTVFLKKPGRKSRGGDGWSIYAKLDMYLWLGDYERLKHDKPYLAKLPPGFEEHYGYEEVDMSGPPVTVVYERKYEFQLRAYLYQARSLIGSDLSGLSDPFARVICGCHCQATQVMKETLCPLWDETLILDNIEIFGPPEDLVLNPPTIAVEVYDYDLMGDPEFIGRCLAVPKIKLEDETYEPAILDWHGVYRGSVAAGEILAAFDLLEVNSSSMPALPSTRSENRGKTIIFNIPQDLRPEMINYRLEVHFRGVRELGKIHMLPVKHPKVIIECAGQPIVGFSSVLESAQIRDAELNSNFDEPVKYMDIALPADSMLWPPITVRCMDCRSFGRTILVGIGIIENLQDFKFTTEKELEQERQQAISGSNNAGSNVVSELAVVHETITPGPATADSVAVDIPDLIPLAINTKEQNLADSAKIDMDKIEKAGPKIAEEVQGGNVTLAGVPKSTGQPSVGGKSMKSKTMNAAVLAKLEKERLINEQKAKQLYRELISDCDWWSKYYVTKEDFRKARSSNFSETHLRLKGNGEGSEDDDDDDDAADKDDDSDDGYSLGLVDYSRLDTEKLAQLQRDAKKRAMEMEDEDEKKKRKKLEKKNRKKKLREKLIKMKGAVNRAFSKAEDGDDVSEIVEEEVEDKSHISRIQDLWTHKSVKDADSVVNYRFGGASKMNNYCFYDCELEKLPEFGGFEGHFKTYKLLHGKKSFEDEDDDDVRLCGYFKGNFCVYKLDYNEDEVEAVDEGDVVMDFVKELQSLATVRVKKIEESPTPELLLTKNLPPFKILEVKVIVYIIRVHDLHPLDMNGLADPYLVVRCGRKKVDDKKNKLLNQLNPVFGRMFEFDVELPNDSFLDVEVWDYDSLSADDMIGSTTIDLENRFFSPHRPRCGLQKKYEIFGYNIWRDPQLPTQILDKLCKDIKIDPPEYGQGVVTVADMQFSASETVQNETGEDIQTQEHLALEVLKHWDSIPGGFKLVPEHIETRSLLSSERRGEQGRVEMWVDMFPKDQPMPSVSLDITPRKPELYELRCIIWNTDDVSLDDVNPLTGERSSDIYVKGYIKGPGEDLQQTDIHYRSLTGEGNFNWRFVFSFEYLKAEEKIVYYKKESFFDVGEKEYKIPPVLTLQLWDADLISADDMLGSISLDLNKILRPAKNPKFCTLGMLDTKMKSATLNLFKSKRCKGWWPATAVEKDEENGEEEDKIILKGKIEVELQLVTAEEAELAPVGLGRSEPEPLSLPNRPDTSFTWFMNPLKSLYYIVWKNWKWKILKFFIILLLIVLLGLLIYTLPGAITGRIVNPAS